MKLEFFNIVAVLVLQYGCTEKTLTTRFKKKIDGNSTKMLHAILNKSWKQFHAEQQL